MKIITSVVNSTEFIQIQYHTLKKYFKGDYDFIVFNDAKDFPDLTNGEDLTIRSKIIDLCDYLDIECINVPNNHHEKMNMSDRHADTFNTCVLTYQKDNPDKYLLIDSDMFLIDYFDIDQFSRYMAAIVPQERGPIKYFWPGLCYMDFTQVSNQDMLNWNICPGLDSGGMMKDWLSIQNPEKIYNIHHLWSCNWNQIDVPKPLSNNEHLIDFLIKDPRNQNGKFYCELYHGVFLHYRGGSNWNNEGMNIHRKLMTALKNILI